MCGVAAPVFSSVTISHSDLASVSLDHQFLGSLGLCPGQVTELVIRNSSLDNIILELSSLKILDLRQNEVDILNRPASDSIEAIYLSGDLMSNYKLNFHLIFIFYSSWVTLS